MVAAILAAAVFVLLVILPACRITSVTHLTGDPELPRES